MMPFYVSGSNIICLELKKKWVSMTTTNSVVFVQPSDVTSNVTFWNTLCKCNGIFAWSLNSLVSEKHVTLSHFCFIIRNSNSFKATGTFVLQMLNQRLQEVDSNSIDQNSNDSFKRQKDSIDHFSERTRLSPSC